ncbi:hypothetical protein [Paenibacillus glycanilyticus]|uniref:Uncharacterized protein n=1 Tax=Paenibacillus glycanilyticus TaxID=126569 RepID=A0ABQ6G9E1_9BACL|nr:hypothetical protein [Paenibacillus glycanilyticus]GLX65692.1 hypothetical protein MU1_00360 [Paenibacillus glycanilyticus]
MNPTQSARTNSYVFQVELLIEGDSNGAALEKLIKSLNQGGYTDYRILNGIQLGRIIDQRKSELPGIQQIPVPPFVKPAAPAPATAASAVPSINNGLESFRACMKNNKLIRLIVNKGLGIKLSIPCRILNIDEQGHLVTVYHVDEKQVYTFRLNEIEDFQV